MLKKLVNNPVGRYFTEAKQELEKVAWPTSQRTKNYTILVIAVSLAVAIFLGSLDYLFNLGLQLII